MPKLEAIWRSSALRYDETVAIIAMVCNMIAWRFVKLRLLSRQHRRAFAECDLRPCAERRMVTGRDEIWALGGNSMEAADTYTSAAGHFVSCLGLFFAHSQAESPMKAPVLTLAQSPPDGRANSADRPEACA